MSWNILCIWSDTVFRNNENLILIKDFDYKFQTNFFFHFNFIVFLFNTHLILHSMIIKHYG